MGDVANDKMKASKDTETVVTDLVDLDTILREEVGQFGWFQIRNITLALIAIVFLGLTNKAYVFTTARIPSRCHIPVCDISESGFTPDWLLNAVPGTSLTSFDNCQRFGNASTAPLDSSGLSPSATCPAAWFNRHQLQDCERRLYQNTDTVVFDFNLACDEWRRTMIGSIRISATILAHPITGFISDRWGRRAALVFNAFNAGWIGILKSFSDSYIFFVVSEFVQSTFGSGTMQAANILLMELVSPESRVLAGACLYTSLSIGYVTLGFIAWAVPNWRHLTWVLCIPQLAFISYLWLMSESVRWYISKGRYQDSKKALETIARNNKKQISAKSLELLRKNAEEREDREASREHLQTQIEPSLIKLLFQYRSMLVRCLITSFMWISFTLIYHGLAINAVEISGNKYVNFIAVAGAQIPGFWISFLLLDKIGRKPVLGAAYWMCAACQIGFMFMPKEQYVLSLLLYMVGASCSGAILSSLYIYTAELYPTRYRHRLFAFSSTVGRVGAIIAPLTPALGKLVWAQFPFALFAGCACGAGALVLLAPETRGERLPDTMQQAADIGRKSRQPSTNTI